MIRTPQALRDARYIVTNLAAFAHRPRLVALAWLVIRSARGNAPRQTAPQVAS
jgi:hypothetical protein